MNLIPVQTNPRLMKSLFCFSGGSVRLQLHEIRSINSIGL